MKFIGIKDIIRDLEDLKRRWKKVAVQTGRSQRRGSAITSGVPAKPARARKPAPSQTPITFWDHAARAGQYYKLHKDAEAADTHRVATLKTSYKSLLKHIGPPHHSDHDHSEVFQWAFLDDATGDSVFIYLEPEAHMRGHETGKAAFDKVREAASMDWGVLAKDNAIGKRFLAWFKKHASHGGLRGLSARGHGR